MKLDTIKDWIKPANFVPIFIMGCVFLSLQEILNLILFSTWNITFVNQERMLENGKLW